jgi:hypothetical protein
VNRFERRRNASPSRRCVNGKDVQYGRFPTGFIRPDQRRPKRNSNAERAWVLAMRHDASHGDPDDDACPVLRPLFGVLAD